MSDTTPAPLSPEELGKALWECAWKHITPEHPGNRSWENAPEKTREGYRKAGEEFALAHAAALGRELEAARATLDAIRLTCDIPMDSPTADVVACASSMRRELEAARAFKAYVHKRLDDAGVPADPESPHKAEGCRIGGRLDVVLGELEAARAEVKSAWGWGYRADVEREAAIDRLIEIDEVFYDADGVACWKGSGEEIAKGWQEQVPDFAAAIGRELEAARALPEKRRGENGDYPESKRDCADELDAALSRPAPPSLSDKGEALEELVKQLADPMRWNWTKQNLDERSAADRVLRVMAELDLIDWQHHPLGGDVWGINGRQYGRVDVYTPAAASPSPAPATPGPAKFAPQRDIGHLLAKAAPDIVRGDDGEFIYWPQGNAGAYSPWSLRVIADELDRRNSATPASTPLVEAAATPGLAEETEKATEFQGEPNLEKQLSRAIGQAEEARGLLERAKSEIYLASHGNPELVSEIERFLAGDDAADMPPLDCKNCGHRYADHSNHLDPGGGKCFVDECSCRAFVPSDVALRVMNGDPATPGPATERADRLQAIVNLAASLIQPGDDGPQLIGHESFRSRLMLACRDAREEAALAAPASPSPAPGPAGIREPYSVSCDRCGKRATWLGHKHKCLPCGREIPAPPPQPARPDAAAGEGAK